MIAKASITCTWSLDPITLRSGHGVFAPLPFAPFAFAKESKIQLNPFVREALIKLHGRLAFLIVKEQPMLSGIRRQETAASPSSLAAHRARLSVLCLLNSDYRLVELIGIEPTTPCLQSRCSPS